MDITSKVTDAFVTKQKRKITDLNADIVDFEMILQNDHCVDMVGAEQFELMSDQLEIMKAYRDILIYRLTRLGVGEQLV